MSWSAEYLRALADQELRTIAAGRVVEPQTQRLPVVLGASESESVMCVRITGFGPGSMTFVADRIRPDGQSAGATFTVHAFARCSAGGQVDAQDLTQVTPAYVAGDVLRIQWQRIWSGSAWVDGWFAVDTFHDGGGAGDLWAQLIAVGDTYLNGRLYRKIPNSSPPAFEQYGDLLTIRVLGMSAGALTGQPVLLSSCPKFAAGQTVRVCWMADALIQDVYYPAGYWTRGVAYNTCF